MMDYQTAVRGAFFDIAGVAETPDEVAAQARYLDDGLLFLRDGKIIALCCHGRRAKPFCIH